MSLLDSLLLDPARLDVWIAVRTDGVAGTGTESDPYDGSTQVKFDALMNSFAAYTTIHLGPGTFETRGYSNAALGGGHPTWQPKAGMKILGSGIDVTYLKIVNAGSYNNTTLQNGLYFAIGATFGNVVDYFEVSDLTIDSNLAGQPVTPGLGYAHLACGAIDVTGSYVRIRRVKAINWGTQTELSECFVLVAGTAHPSLPELVNPIIEDCICVQPNEHNRRETTIVHIGGSENPADHTMLFSRGPVLRRNLVDCAFSGGRYNFRITSYQSTSWANGTATFIGKRPHTRQVNEYVAITNPDFPANKWNGLFKITNITFVPPDPNKFEFAMPDPGTDEHTTILCGTSFQALSMGMCRGGVVEDNVVLNTWIGGPYQDTYHTRDFTIRRNTYRNVVSGVYFLMGGLSAPPQNIASLIHQGGGVVRATVPKHAFVSGELIKILLATPSSYNGSFTISNVTQDTFDYTVMPPPSGNGSGGIAERAVAGLTTLNHLGGGGAEALTPVVHRIGVGDRIKVSNASPNDFNGFFDVTAVPTTVKFQYQMPTTPGGNAANATFQRVWGVDRSSVEANTFELADLVIEEWGAPPAAVILSDGVTGQILIPQPPPYVFGDIVVRDNSVRYVDGTTGPYFSGVAIQIASAKRAIQEGNVVECVPPNPISHARSGVLEYFNNSTPSGSLIRGYDSAATTQSSELTTAVEDAYLISI